MTNLSRSDRHAHGRAPLACLATVVLVLATGMPWQSVPHLLPHPGEQPAPYLGV